MELKIVCDNRPYDASLKLCWGFSCLVGEHLLFDTGEDGAILLHNMAQLGIDPKNISTVVISHDHHDHTGGLESLLGKNPQIQVYGLAKFSRTFKKKIVDFSNYPLMESDKFANIAPGIYTTGEIMSSYGGGVLPEQSLIIEGEEGLTIITGCAHPGIIEILQAVRSHFSQPFYLVMGGFHLMQDSYKVIEFVVSQFKELRVGKVAPTHCTGEEAIQAFKLGYGEDFLEVGAGRILET